MIKQLYEIANKCIEEMQENKRMIMTLEDGRRHGSDNICHICNEEIYKCKEIIKYEIMTTEPEHIGDPLIVNVL